MDTPKVLVLRPGLEAGGGVNYYFTAIRPYLPATIEFLYRGARHYPYRSNIVYESGRIVFDYLNFVYHILFRKYDLIHINTILNLKGIIRDSVYIMTARLFGKRFLIFFRGWDDEIEQEIERKHRRRFRYIVSNAEAIVSLSSDSLAAIRNWGYTGHLILETTTVDKAVIRQIKEEDILSKNFETSRINILYLGRIEKDKGIYLCLDTFALLQRSLPDIQFHIAGDGTEYENVVRYIERNEIKNVKMYGFVKGKAKIDLLRNSHFFILTSNKEGLPNALLEAIAAGLVIIARPIAGIKDVIIDGKNGYVSDSKIAEDFADIIFRSISDPVKLKMISENNYIAARDKYYSDVVAQRLVTIYKTITES